MENINTSRAQQVSVDIFNYDNIPLAGTYTSGASPIDLTDYKFEFFLYQEGAVIETYTIDAGDLSATYLSKTGAGVNVLNMELMFEDIRDNAVEGVPLRLVQVVTDDDGKTYAYVIYNINAKHY